MTQLCVALILLNISRFHANPRSKSERGLVRNVLWLFGLVDYRRTWFGAAVHGPRLQLEGGVRAILCNRGRERERPGRGLARYWIYPKGFLSLHE